MAGIPPALESDLEDVAWALQTADALWKRGERQDAIVWLRRAAQTAGDAEDDDRALWLARNAAELADWLSRHSAAPGPLHVGAHSAPHPSASGAIEEVDDLLVESEIEALPAADVASVHDLADPSAPTLESAGDDEREDGITSPNMSIPASARVSSSPPTQRVAPERAPASAPMVALASVVPTLKPGRPTALPPPLLRVSPGRMPAAPPASVAPPAPLASPTLPEAGAAVPTAAQAHAGMLDPWAEGDAPNGASSGSSRSRSGVPRGDHSASAKEADDVVTSAPVVARPSRSPRAEDRARPAPAPSASLPPAPKAESGVVGIPADWPDVARRSLALHAVQRELARDEEVSGFALVAVLNGSVDVAATIVDAPAERLEAGALLRARGTIEAAAPLRVIAASKVARVATWNEKNLTHAFASSPRIEGELREAGNRIQALVGATMGPLGERLDPSLRMTVTGRLRLRVVGEGEVVAKAGEPVPGLVIVGVGELEIVGRAGDAGVLRSGDFLFPSEVLRAASAPHSVRGLKGGALLLVADRSVAQELLMTCPPLLEILAEA